ncbi:hydroxymethylglutaryl-CoA lyase [Pseudomonas kermanshahensis]|uniref:hydroxymethylglutaryl-CoA lyase n=1 Tax=Pseudomonas kermanshahensis TaxID=2745482 RepID=UPI0023DA72CE|nr:hydroxymethylglutaryl-CoA lyase [Pseudomonas kermanshahensis]WEL53026.1 hydroxymethylglutaryl-CoA lyase [Pseudomonas kermanshahensis]
MTLPLQGIKVIEMGQLIAGPFAAKMLAEFGADVIKIEPPVTGDPLRKWRMLHNGTSVWWASQSRNKRSITLDLRQAEAHDVVKRLVADADILIENFRPGTLEKWGLGWDVLREINPRLVMLRVSGYGQSGPYRDLPGFGVIGEAMGGLRHLSGEPGRTPVRVGVSIGDSLSALHGVQEVATRDGFQNEVTFIETADKISMIDTLSQCGFAKIEVTSFTSPKAIPALRDAEAVMHGIKRQPGVEYTVLVPNVRGAERALGCGIDEANLVMSVSEPHNRSNLRMTREDSFAQLKEVVSVIGQGPVAVNVSLSTVFGCPMQGDVAFAEVMSWVARFADLGVRGVTLCDTTGMAFPSQVKALSAEVLKRFPELQVTLHFHNTRGMALANTLAALEAGVDRFDASLGGLGGCPYAPGASGNVCTEDLVHMLDLIGYDTGVDLDKILLASARLPGLIGHSTPSQILKAGKRLNLHPIPDHVHNMTKQVVSAIPEVAK